jgi:hypothetical protein
MRFHLYEMSGTGKSIDRKWISGFRVWGSGLGKREWRMTVMGMYFFLG